MILFCGIPSEPPLAAAIRAAEQASLHYALFNQRESHFAEVVLKLEGDLLTGLLRLHEIAWPLEEFAGVYLRLMDWSRLPENVAAAQQPNQQQIDKSRLLHEALIEWVELTDCRVLNRVSAMSSNVSKPYQAQLIRASGFAIPPTLVTNDPEAVSGFIAVHQRVIYKSVSSIRSIVCELRSSDLAALKKVRNLPTQFQAFISGVNIRVHVVGSQIFATSVESEAVDYRYAGREGHQVVMSAIKLPEEIQERCLNLSRALNLPLCGIDLKLTLEGCYYCFEVNPSPAYTYYEERTGQPIARALVKWLAHGEN
jgi:glutathione synthase/RimK-type ligase-like ATP-grasp enzyme